MVKGKTSNDLIVIRNKALVRGKQNCTKKVISLAEKGKATASP
jgi:hypothetical protein